MAGLFRPGAGHETKRTANETISGVREDVWKLAMVTNPANEMTGRTLGVGGRITGDCQ